MSNKATRLNPDRLREEELPMRVIVRNVTTDDIVAEHDVDFNSKSAREWFNDKLIVWALLNTEQPLSVEILAPQHDV